ncbi:MAG: hypothetical protein ACE362_08980 [Phaeodactylibacter xiamenensis]|uniref:Uncharacterized protein n=1 Tax=Phaeodactylibacter xiamenensis TaxID=1524460 RepID=A0A098S8M9_9BACT|nr:hypothetical protein [Phaeodactylibacter xiamenensis]KGE88480.1 hypothetical protein IX84_07235 [Phaeodactylibacter xiamenensis]MCR9054356.1 hypothetical protein [bacterium]
MENVEIKDERIARVSDLLEQIKSVDEIISLHEEKEDQEDLMLIQYKYRRAQFLGELKDKLQELNITPTDLIAA